MYFCSKIKTMGIFFKQATCAAPSATKSSSLNTKYMLSGGGGNLSLRCPSVITVLFFYEKHLFLRYVASINETACRNVWKAVGKRGRRAGTSGKPSESADGVQKRPGSRRKARTACGNVREAVGKRGRRAEACGKPSGECGRRAETCGKPSGSADGVWRRLLSEPLLNY